MEVFWAIVTRFLGSANIEKAPHYETIQSGVVDSLLSCSEENNILQIATAGLHKQLS